MTGGEFCSEEHRLAYAHEQSNLALSRLIDEQTHIHNGKKPRRRGIALPLPRAANGNGSHGKTAVQGGHDPAFCQWLYATTPRMQNYRSRLRAGESSLERVGELAIPGNGWRVVRRKLAVGGVVELSGLARAMATTGACMESEGAWEAATAVHPAAPPLALRPEWDREPAGEPRAWEPSALGTLVAPRWSLEAKNWSAPMRSALPRPRAVEASAPALPAHLEARLQVTLHTDLPETHMAPLLHSCRIMGKAVPSQNGFRPIPAEVRLWDTGGSIPRVASQPQTGKAQPTNLTSIQVLAAKGPLGWLPLLEGELQANSRPLYPAPPAVVNGLGLRRAGKVLMQAPLTNAGQRPVQSQARGIFPLPFLVPPLSPRIAEAAFRAPLETIKPLTLAPRRGVESYQVSSPAVAELDAVSPAAERPRARLKPVLDWLPAFGRPVATPHTVNAQWVEPLQARRAAGFTGLVMGITPALAASATTLEQPVLRTLPVKLLRLTMERVEMQNVKLRPRASMETHTPQREVLKPRARLEPRTVALRTQPEIPAEAPLWRRKLDGAGQAWNRLPAVPKWSGLLAAALALAVGLGTRGSYTTEARAPKPEPPAMTRVSTDDGSLAGLQKTILDRAAIALTDDFRAGLADWEGQGDWARSWSYDSAGFVRTGSLALYTPTLSLTDYRLEFLGQIESRSLSWVVRAKDFRNFYAVKLTLRDDGPVPSAYLQRYAVIDGQPTEAVQKRLPLQVTQDTLYRVLMEARGPNYVLTVQGQIVDSWSEHRLQSGGVGFFSAKGELARLRWVGVWHQYDALGRLCAFLAPYSISDRERSGGQ